MTYDSNKYMVDDPLSYKSIQNSIRNFRQKKNDSFNRYDEPGTFWFKPMFYFYRNDTADGAINNEGLLHPSWLVENGIGSYGDGVDNDSESTRKRIVEQGFITSAYNYLMRNDEQKRAQLLKRFIELLSNISSRSPWYFQSVSGLDTALDRSDVWKDGKFVSDERKQITFKLLPDAIDTRVGTLIDLYRSVCYSWKSKREILPVNLRKFDMGIYIFGSMIQNDKSDILHSRVAMSGSLEAAQKLGLDTSSKQTIVNAAGKYEYDISVNKIGDNGLESYSLSPKGQANIYLEFTNCEINLSSVKGGDEVSNSEGSTREYTLTIDYDDCYVNRYNDFIIGAIGDAITSDLDENSNQSNDYENEDGKYTTGSNIGRKVKSETVLGKLVDSTIDTTTSSTVGSLTQTVQNYVGKVAFGNISTYGLESVIGDFTSGRGTSLLVNTVKKSISGNNSTSTQQTDTVEELKTGVTENIYEPKPLKSSRVASLGNIYRGIAAVNNL